MSTSRLATSAVYFPHTQIASEKFVAHALLLWDHIYTIVPRGSFEDVQPSSRIDQAAALVVSNVRPTEEVQTEVHRALETLLEGSRVPQWLSKSLPKSSDFPELERYPIYLRKFAPETWRLLQRAGLVDAGEEKGTRQAKPATGLLLMSLLANAMAGKGALATVTDRRAAYDWLESMMAGEERLAAIDVQDIADRSEDYLVAVRVTMKVLKADAFKLDELIKVRERELGGDTSVTIARHNYLKLLAEYPAEAASHSDGSLARRELDYQYELRCKECMRELEEALKRPGLDALLSDKLVTPIVTGGAVITGYLMAGTTGAVVGGATGAVNGILGVAKAKREYSNARITALRTNPMSWGYVAAGKSRWA